MRRTGLVLLAVLTGVSPAGAEEPPYQRLLHGDDAKKAAALVNSIDDLWAAGKFAEAVAPAEELLALRQRVQGEGHHEAQDAARLVAAMKKAASLPAAKRAALAETFALMEQGRAAEAGGKRAEAEALFRKALAAFEAGMGPRHPYTTRGINGLAQHLQAVGRLKEAEALFRQALAAREEVLGAMHPDTANSQIHLAENLAAQDRDREAEPLWRRALAVREAVLGPRNPITAATCNHLALNLQDQGKRKEAEPLFRRALDIYEEVKGPRHSDVAIIADNLARNLAAQGRGRDAEPYFRKVLSVWEEVKGPKHADTILTRLNLALNLQGQQKYKEAEPLLRQVLAVREEVLGPTHLDTAQSYRNLGSNLQAQGRAREAEVLHRQALAVYEKVKGPRDPATAAACNSLGSDLQDQGRALEAERLFRKALAIQEEVLGPRSTDTAASANNLALNLDAQGRHKEAEAMHRKVQTLLAEVVGPRHVYSALNSNNLALNLDAQRRYREAEPLYRQALAVFEEGLGPRHPHVALASNNLGLNLKDQGRALEAEPLLRKALQIREEVLGPRHPLTATTCHNLALNLQEQNRLEDAEVLFRKGLPVFEQVQGPQHPQTALNRAALADNLQAQGRYREAEPLWRQAADAVGTMRLRLANKALDRAAAVRFHPYLGLAACLARLGRPTEAWEAAEAGASGVLDALAVRAALPADPDSDRRFRERASRLDALDRLLIPLLTREKLDEADRRRRDDLVADRARLDEENTREAAERSRGMILALGKVQACLAPDEALVCWVDLARGEDHWAGVLRCSGAPTWVRLLGSGPRGAWTADDVSLARRVRDDLARGEPDAERRARLLAAQRLDPLAPHLAARGDLPAVRKLVVIPVAAMAGIPVEVLTDRSRVSYVPSGSVLARLREKHRVLESPTLLALADPNFNLPGSGPPPEPPEQGVYLSLVLPDGNAARAGLRAGDVLLSYGGARLKTPADLKVAEGGESVPVVVWREGKTIADLRVSPGKLGAVLSGDPPAVALRKRREVELLADARDRAEIRPLPGTRVEAAALAALLPRDKSTLLLGSKASEQDLTALAAAKKLKDYRLVHLATHATVDLVSAADSSLLLARDSLPAPNEQDRLRAAGKKPPTGRLSVETIADTWDLDADLVTLSACQTGRGPDGGGEGLLGFSQVLLGKGARSVVLSLWKVDDTATALLMTRFYQNLLGKRDGLKAPLPRAEALQEAKAWLRTLRRAEVEALAGKLAKGVVRGPEEPAGELLPALPAGAAPFAHPRFWAAFILIGDPE